MSIRSWWLGPGPLLETQHFPTHPLSPLAPPLGHLEEPPLVHQDEPFRGTPPRHISFDRYKIDTAIYLPYLVLFGEPFFDTSHFYIVQYR